VGAEPVAGFRPQKSAIKQSERNRNGNSIIGLDFINDIVNPEGKISHTAAPAAERGFAKGYADQPKHSPFFGRLHEIEALEAESSGMDFHPELKAELATRKENHAKVESKCERGKHGTSNSVENPACVAALRVEILRLRQLVADLLLKNQRLRHALGKLKLCWLIGRLRPAAHSQHSILTGTECTRRHFRRRKISVAAVER